MCRLCVCDYICGCAYTRVQVHAETGCQPQVWLLRNHLARVLRQGLSLGPMAQDSSRLASEQALRLILSLPATRGITGVYHSAWRLKKM